MRFFAFAVLFASLGGSAGMAAEPPSPVIGAGNALCSTWVTARREGDPVNESAVISWMHGYLTAANERASESAGRPVNIFTSGPAASADADLWSFIDLYCAEHPQETLHAAATALTEALLARDGISLSR